MGNNNSVCRVHCDVPSPTFYEMNSVVSDPIGHLIDFDSFWKQLVDLIRTGSFAKGDPNLKELKLMYDTPEGCAFLKTWDGEKLELDADVQWEQTFHLLEGRGIIWEECRPLPYRTLREVACIIIHKRRMRVEHWRQTMSQTRSADFPVALNLIGTLISALEVPSVDVKIDQESLKTPGSLSVMSEDLSEKVKDFDELWDRLIEVFKTRAFDNCKRWVEVRDAKKDEEAGIETFTTSVLVDGPALAAAGMIPEIFGDSDRLMSYRCRADKSKRFIVVDVMDMALMTVFREEVFAVNTEPYLCVEAWTHIIGDRRCGPILRAIVEITINTIIKDLREEQTKAKAIKQEGEAGEGEQPAAASAGEKQAPSASKPAAAANAGAKKA